MNELLTQLTSNANIETFLFYAAALIMLPLAFGVLLDRVVIRAGFLLIGVFGGVSLLFLLLQAQFLAMAQMMIYAVGITLVVVIALMLTNPRLQFEKSIDLPEQRVPGFLSCGLVFMVLYMAILSEAWPKMNDFPDHFQNLKILGTGLLKQYVLPFEFASVLLLIALIGAVMLAKADRNQPDEELTGDKTAVVESEGNQNVVVE